eukprot:COSAG02_NODE_1860_length_10613_cov_40.769831_4_plen_49_part_00
MPSVNGSRLGYSSLKSRRGSCRAGQGGGQMDHAMRKQTDSAILVWEVL